MRFLAILGVFLSLHTGMFGSESLLKQANQLYADGKYSEAISSYESILSSQVESAALYFNLGNAYYKTGKIPQAVLNYERALRLNPTDEDIQFNLQVANSLVVDQLDNVPEFFLNVWMKSFRQIASVQTWTLLTLISFVLLLLAVWFYFTSHRIDFQKLSFVLGIVLLVTFSVSLTHTLSWAHELKASDAGIIFSPSALVKGSPDTQGTDLFMLHEGTKVQVIDSVGDWAEIRLVNGNEGWLEFRHLEII